MGRAEGPGRSTSELSNYIAWGVQSAKNVEATTFYFSKHMNGSGYDAENETSQERVGGSGKEIGLVYKTAVKADGSVITYGWPDGFARLLAVSLGADAVTAVPASGGSQLTSHLITPTTGGTLPYLTVDQNWADETERVTNCLISDLKIEGEAGKPVKLTAQFISGGTPYVRGSAIAPVVRESGTPLMIPGASALWSVSAESLSGVESAEVTKWSVEVKNTLDDAIRTLSLFREDVVWNMIDFNFDCTIKYVNRESWNVVHYGGGTQVPVAVPTGAFSFYSGQQSSNGSLSAYLAMPFLEVGNVKVNRLDPDGKTMYLDFTAFGVANATYSLYGKLVTNATQVYTNPAT